MTEDMGKVTCFIDEDEVDCETWGETTSKEEGDEIESSLDFLSLVGE